MKKLNYILTIISLIALVLSISLAIASCSIVMQNDPSEQTSNIVNLTETTTCTESEIYTTETTIKETVTGETTSVEKTTTEEATTKVIEITTEKEHTTSSVTTTKAVETTTKKSVEKTTKTAAKKTNLPDYLPDYNALNMFDKVNDYRVQKGINKMILDEELCKMAYIRAKEQAIKTGHTRPDGRRFSSVANDHNYNYVGLGENIARGPYNDSDKMFVMWQESASHNENMLDKEWTRSGMAYYQKDDGSCVYIQLFAY